MHTTCHERVTIYFLNCICKFYNQFYNKNMDWLCNVRAADLIPILSKFLVPKFMTIPVLRLCILIKKRLGWKKII